MTKPTKQELIIALEEASKMKEQDQDPKFVAKALLNSHYREQYFEKVFHLAERYLLFGQDEHEHQELIKAIEYARSEERHINKDDEAQTFGL